MARILVIDDSPSVLATLRRTLEAAGHEVDELTNFLDLPAKVRDTPPDLIILDLNMPMMPGQMAAQYIRKYQEQDMPILIHSSRDPVELAEAVEKTGACGYVQKGEPEGVLLGKVAEVVAAKGGR